MIEKERLVQLVQDAQNQKEGAFNALYETFFEDTYYFINKTVNDPDLAADLTQDTFMDVFEKIGQLQEPTALVSWIRQIAYHRCTGYFRKRKEILLDENEEGGTLFDTVEEERTEFIPDAALDQEDLKRTILQMINDLPLEQRTAVLMRYYDELSVAEIAAAQGVSEGTVKSRLNYGRKAIKECVESYEKKNGVKLHSVAIIPILLWLFRFSKLKGGRSLTNTKVAHKVVSTANTATAATATTTATATTAGAKATAVAAGKAAGTATGKAAGGAVVKGFLATTAAKVIAGVTAAALVVGGVGIAIASNTADKDSKASAPRQTVNGLALDDDGLVTVYLIDVLDHTPTSESENSSTITYDNNGFPTEVHYSGTGDIYTYAYENNTIKTITKTGRWITTYNYDAQGNLLSYRKNSTEHDDIIGFGDYAYDEQNRLVYCHDDRSDLYYEYSYDGNKIIIDLYDWGKRWRTHAIAESDEYGNWLNLVNYPVEDDVIDYEAPFGEESHTEEDFDDDYIPIPVKVHSDHIAPAEGMEYSKNGTPISSTYCTYKAYRISPEYLDEVMALQEEMLQRVNRFERLGNHLPHPVP